MSRKLSLPSGVGGITLAQIMALVPPSIVMDYANPAGFSVLLVAALITSSAWEGLFAVVRKKPLSFHGVTTAMIVAILVPPDLPVWQLVFALSLGTVLAELIFGGRGFGFLSPTVVTVSLLVFSFPEAHLAPGTATLAWACVPGAILLLVTGLISWRVVLGAAVGVGALTLLHGETSGAISAITALVFCLVFLICDPTAAAVTNLGRLLYGLLAGISVVVFSGGPTLTPDAIIFAALIASIFAPLIDHLVVLLHAKRWKTADA